MNQYKGKGIDDALQVKDADRRLQSKNRDCEAAANKVTFMINQLDPQTKYLRQILNLLLCVLVIRVTVAVVLNYRSYLPPDFASDFLQDRESYFFGCYQWAFYTHIFFGPFVLLMGMVLISERFRTQFRHWHRILGRIQTVCVLFLVVPSGLWMAFYAESGLIASAGFASLAIATGLCVALGFRAAIRRRFVNHRRWMWRCYLLLCSAVVLRIMGGIVTVMNFNTEWSYPFAAWASWLLPLVVFETIERFRARSQS